MVGGSALSEQRVAIVLHYGDQFSDAILMCLSRDGGKQRGQGDGPKEGPACFCVRFGHNNLPRWFEPSERAR